MEEKELTGQGSSKGYCKRPIRVVGVCGKGYWGVSFSHGSMCGEVVKWGGFYGYFGEQGLPVGVQECLKGFHRGYVDYPSRQFVPKWGRRVQHLCRWDSPSGESLLATAGTTSRGRVALLRLGG